MPYFNWYSVLNFFILFPAIAGAIRFKFAWNDFYPFLVLLWIGAANDTLSYILDKVIHTNALNSNVYVLVEYFLILWLFFHWNGLQVKKYYILGVAGLLVWILDNFILNSITENNSIFRGFCSIIVLCFSIDRFSKILIFEKDQILRNPQFLICVGFVIYYFCKIFVEVFNAFRVPLGDYFYMHLWLGLSIVNSIANVIFGIAIICIPRKREFTMPY